MRRAKWVAGIVLGIGFVGPAEALTPAQQTIIEAQCYSWAKRMVQDERGPYTPPAYAPRSSTEVGLGAAAAALEGLSAGLRIRELKNACIQEAQERAER